MSDVRTFRDDLVTRLSKNRGEVASVIFELRGQTKIDGLIPPGDEPAAFELIQQTAMRSRSRMRDVAQQIVDGTLTP